MTIRPELSPMVLRLYLHIQSQNAACSHKRDEIGGCAKCRNNYLRVIRRRARVTIAQMDLAVSGKLRAAAPRGRLWRAIGFSPKDNKIRLLDGGKQEAL